MSRARIAEMFEMAGPAALFTGGVDEGRIAAVEERLGVKLPESYKWFLRQYGHGGIGGVEILGVGLAGTPACVEETLYFRRYGLPAGFVVIVRCDEYYYCLDTARMVDGECPVTDWDLEGYTGAHECASFLDFLVEEMTLWLQSKGLL